MRACRWLRPHHRRRRDPLLLGFGDGDGGHVPPLGLPAIVWGAVLPDITYAHEFKEIHRVNGTMIDTNAKFTSEHGYKKVAVIHDNTDYGKGHNKYFAQFFPKDGGQILATFGVASDQQDFTTELTQIKPLKPEALYFGGLTPIGVRIRARMDKLGLVAWLSCGVLFTASTPSP